MYGLLNLHKPAGWTSHDCVAKLRRLLKQKKIGHGGTLDPAATGVLPIAVGPATRLLQYFPKDKAYLGRVRLGTRTTTDDLEGEVLSQQDASSITRSEVEAKLAQFIGTIEQIPPRYSAIQVDGQRLYDRARKGEAFEVPKRTVQVNAIEIVNWHAPKTGAETSAETSAETGTDYPVGPEIELAIACGPGTYIRSIARDLGASLGVGGTLASLIRTRSCGLALDSSVTLETIAEQIEGGSFELLDPAIALQHLNSVQLSPDLVKRWFYGQRLQMEREISTEPVRVEDESGQLLGVGELKLGEENTILAPKLVLADQSLKVTASD